MTTKIWIASFALAVVAPPFAVAAADAASAMPAPITVRMMGDSTMVSYPESAAPQQGWGQRFQEHLRDGVTVVDYAKGGSSTKSTLSGSREWARMQADLKAGDYVVIAFGHNDSFRLAEGDTQEKHLKKAKYVSCDLPEYKDNMRHIVKFVRGRGATPVFATSIPRYLRAKVVDGHVEVRPEGLMDYVNATRELGKELKVPVLDLMAEADAAFRKMSPEEVQSFYMIKAKNDKTHTTGKGADFFASIAARLASEQKLPFAAAAAGCREGTGGATVALAHSGDGYDAAAKTWTDGRYSLMSDRGVGGGGGVWKLSGNYRHTATYTLGVPADVEVRGLTFTNVVEAYKNEGAVSFASDGAVCTPAPGGEIDGTPRTITAAVGGHKAGSPITFIFTGLHTVMFEKLIIDYRVVAPKTAPTLRSWKVTDTTDRNHFALMLAYDRAMAGATAKIDSRRIAAEPGPVLLFPVWDLEYGRTYDTTLDADDVKDVYGNRIASNLTFSVAIGAKPKAAKCEPLVATDFTSLSNAVAALNAVNAGATASRKVVYLRDGDYACGSNRLFITGSNITFLGESTNVFIHGNTVLTSTTAPVQIEKGARGVVFQNMVVRNDNTFRTGEFGGQSLAVKGGDHTVFDNVILQSNQDTFLANGPTYYRGGEICGSVDFIYGDGDIFITNTTLTVEDRPGNVILAPGTSSTVEWGIVLAGCTIAAAPGATRDLNGTFTLGRPWKGEPRACYLNTTMKIKPSAGGWGRMSNILTHMYEYGSVDADGNPVDLSGRASGASPLNSYYPVLTAEAAAKITCRNVLDGRDSWDPTECLAPVAKPVLTVSGRNVSWTDDDYASCYVVLADGAFATATTKVGYVAPDGVKTVRVAALNASGTVGAVSDAAIFQDGDTIDLSGAGWTVERNGETRPAVVPTTTEAVFADLSDYTAPDHDKSRHDSWIVQRWITYKGKSVWRKRFTLPEVRAGERVFLCFERTRYFADIVVNGKPCHHDEAPDMPYEVDVTGAVKPGENLLEVKIDNPPGGDYDWRDYMTTRIGDAEIPGGRAFGGVQGKVTLAVRDAVYVGDLWIRNTDEPHKVVVEATVVNATDKPLEREVALAVEPLAGAVLAEKRAFAPGETVLSKEVSAPAARLWELDSPNLYTATAKVGDESFAREFGFRSFTVEGVGKDAVLKLNGKRIVIRTAIGWGWYIGTGTVPSDEDAKREVATAKALGLNAISFHRHMGQENILREADRQGLLVYAEPGAFQSGKHSDWGMKITTERVTRYVKAFRSHPSLFHWNLMNELTGDTNDKQRKFFEDSVRLVHRLDPSRTVTLTSAWAQEGIKTEHLHKMHMRPYDDNLYLAGWYDFHRATGPTLAYGANEYKSPTKYYSYTKNRAEIVYWGEEGAFSAPPRLQLILDEFDRRGPGSDGVDGAIYRAWAKKINGFLDRKDLRGVFPTLDAFCLELSRQSFLHQGRKIELSRMGDVADGYAVNGWESMPVENNSGIVDTMRNPKGDPAIMRKYNAPLKLAVHAQPVVGFDKKHEAVANVDVHIINEVDVKGPQKLVVEAVMDGKVLSTETRDVAVTGGETYGELLARDIKLAVPQAGRGEIRARLEGVEGAVGDFPITVFDLNRPKLPKDKTIAICESDTRLSDWFKKRKFPFVPYNENEKADMVLVTRSPSVLPSPIGGNSIRNAAGELGKVDVKWLMGKEVKHAATAPAIALEFPQGAPPAPGIEALSGWSVEVSGTYLARWTGEYRLFLDGPKRKVDRYALYWNGEKREFDPYTGSLILQLKEGEEIPFRFEMTQKQAQKLFIMSQTPEPVAGFDAATLVRKAKVEGSRVVILGNADQWAKIVAEATGVTYNGSFDIGRHWLGGVLFTKADPLFAGFPVNCSVDEAYEDIAANSSRYALMLEGEQLVMGAWQSENCKLGTMVGRIPQGKGEVIISTLEVVPKLGRLGSDKYLYNILGLD